MVYKYTFDSLTEFPRDVKCLKISLEKIEFLYIPKLTVFCAK